MSSRYQSPWRALQREHDRLYGQLARIKAGAGDARWSLGASLALQAIEVSGGMLVISKSKFQTSAIALARQLLETVVRLEYLANGPKDALLHLSATDNRHTAVALSRLEGVKELDSGPTLPSKITEVSLRKQVLEGEGAKGKLTLAQMLEAIDAGHLYVMYQALSSIGHSEMFGLSHLYVANETNPLTLRYPPKKPPGFVEIVDSQVSMLLTKVIPALEKLRSD